MTLVFDAQPLMAFALREPVGHAARALLSRVEAGRENAWCSVVNLAELRYLILRHAPREAGPLLAWLQHIGIKPASANECWREAARIKAEQAIPLADCFAIATAQELEATLVVGPDPDFDVATGYGVDVHRLE